MQNYEKSKLFILGTTINAAFTHEILKNENTFLDENILKVGRNFRSVKVYHPSNVQKDRKVLLTYGILNNNLQKKLKFKYGLSSSKI